MNYSLAKELEDAGFPQISANGRGRILSDPNGLIQNAETVYEPTLEELIEACGGNDGWFELDEQPFKSSKVWEARMSHGFTRPPELEEGSTPTEAVARLWLALNKK